MSNRKKPYEKPTLKGVDMLETGAGVTCCKTIGACKPAARKVRGKGQATLTVS